MPVLPSCLLGPLWDQFVALLPEHVDTHPLGCHNPRIPDRTVFEHVIAALVHGSGYERIATLGCSDRTIRRRVNYWAQIGIAEKIHALALQAYDRMIGLQLDELSVDGCITKAPGGGESAGRSPVDRGKQGLKRLRQRQDPFCAWGVGLHWPDRPQRHPRPDPGWQEVGSGAEPRMDERLRQVAALYREAQPRRGLLPLSVRSDRHAAYAHPPRDPALPLGRPPHHPTPQVIHLLVGLSPSPAAAGAGRRRPPSAASRPGCACT